MNQPDLFDVTQQPLIDEINRLADLNQRLIAAVKELGYADDVHEWDDAWSKMCKLIKKYKEVGETLQTASCYCLSKSQ